jgi:hypothetical protein
MAELTKLESKIGEVLGLAQAAQAATRKVAKLEGADDELVALLDRMHDEAAETERRCEEVASSRDGKKTAIAEQARETKNEAGEMLSTYLAGEDEALDGLEFLTMAEAGEVGHWEIVGVMARKASDEDVLALAEWATPIQQRHLDDVRTASLRLAEEEDPEEPE